MIKFLLPLLLALITGACGASVAAPSIQPEIEVKQEAAIEPTAKSSVEEATPEPTAIPVPTLPAVIYEPEKEENLADTSIVAANLGPLAALEDNLATGLPAPDLDIRALGNWTFNLSEQRGSYVLLYPTVVGCGDCVFTLAQLAAAYSEVGAEDLTVVIIDIFAGDIPEIWLEFVDQYSDMEFIWGVVNSTDFVIDYEIRSLGTILVVDPEGRLVYRRNYPLAEDEFRQLFDLLMG